ncbi:MAG: type II toxin-antitoxin system PemK/MazF family toxin [bacterium]
MQKDYTEWHKKKTEIQNKNRYPIFFHEREVWWCSLGSNIGWEEDGKNSNFSRSVIIFKKFNNDVFWAVPLSTKVKHSKFYVSLNINNTDQIALLSQMRLIDTKRLIRKLGHISNEKYNEIQKAVINLVNL